jgi:hypothetical protein
VLLPQQLSQAVLTQKRFHISRWSNRHLTCLRHAFRGVCDAYVTAFQQRPRQGVLAGHRPKAGPCGPRPKTDAACPACPGGQPAVRCYCSGKCRHQSTRFAVTPNARVSPTRRPPPLVKIVTRSTHSMPLKGSRRCLFILCENARIKRKQSYARLLARSVALMVFCHSDSKTFPTVG